ncbi:hypothetical protein [Cryptosporangium aurantiacum]|uniref:Uncharacterized protein n=1 Tax=Cryptosporangium aurantiacum TaxID=134849 RepID=A0A1M7RJV7_9ACTN|nr:hypothetical protein [Cryptosporangium aurantiacum]SHN46452.1 hypothetical protein SAMN05443668_115141 [Cryptosporangium aurantiacum]
MAQPTTTDAPITTTHPYAYWVHYGFVGGEGSCDFRRSAPIRTAADVHEIADLISDKVGQTAVVRSWQQFPTGH